MKIKYLLFAAAAIAFAAAVIAFGTAISFYIGIPMRGTSSDQPLTHIKKQLEYNVNSSIEEEIAAKLIACHVDNPEIFNDLAAKVKYESSVLTKTGNGKYMGFVKISTGDIIKVEILIDDDSFYYETKENWERLQHSIIIERQKMGIQTDFEKKQEASRKRIEEFENRNSIFIDRSYKPLNYHGIVTGILFDKENPLTVIDGEVFREGQNVKGVKVVKINHDAVEFEKSGVRWSQRVNEPVSANWP